MTSLVEIDGSQGEGGGQILRSSLGLSLVTGRPFRITGIRAGRKKPGLLRQHLTAVEAAVAVSGASAEGASLGSLSLTFHPGRVAPGAYSFAVGTAGSATLVFQTVLPALLVAPGETTLTLEGGTHNPWAPPFDFLEQAFVPLLVRMGAEVSVSLERPGFYPGGGGRFVARVVGGRPLSRLTLLERGEVRSRRAVAMLAHLPRHVAERELATVRAALGWDAAETEIVDARTSRGPGNVVTLTISADHVTEVFTAFGGKGISSGTVAEGAVAEARRWLAHGAPVGEHLADQLLVPMATFAGGEFRTGSLSRHTATNIDVLRAFLDVPVAVETGAERVVTVRVG